MIIVDNAVYSFGAQLANGIPITPFKDDKDDTEFISLMSYVAAIKDYDDLRVPNRAAFKMEQVYKFNLDNYIQYYDYDLCDQHSDDEYSDQEDHVSKGEFSDQLKDQAKELTSETDNPFASGCSDNSTKNKSSNGDGGIKSANSFKMARLPKSIKLCLDGFSEKMAKTKSLHTKKDANRLIPSKDKKDTKSIC